VFPKQRRKERTATTLHAARSRANISSGQAGEASATLTFRYGPQCPHTTLTTLTSPHLAKVATCPGCVVTSKSRARNVASRGKNLFNQATAAQQKLRSRRPLEPSLHGSSRQTTRPIHKETGSRHPGQRTRERGSLVLPRKYVRGCACTSPWSHGSVHPCLQHRRIMERAAGLSATRMPTGSLSCISLLLATPLAPRSPIEGVALSTALIPRLL